MPECDIFNFKDVTLTVRKWFFFFKRTFGNSRSLIDSTSVHWIIFNIFLLYRWNADYFRTEKGNNEISVCHYILSYEFTPFFSKTFFHISLLSLLLLLLLLRLSFGSLYDGGEDDENGGRCVRPPPEQHQRTRKGSREADPRGRDTNWWQTDWRREANLTAPNWQEKKGQTDQKTHKFHERSHPGIGHSAVKPCDRCWFSVLYCHLVEAATDSNNWFNWVTTTN